MVRLLAAFYALATVGWYMVLSQAKSGNTQCKEWASNIDSFIGPETAILRLLGAAFVMCFILEFTFKVVRWTWRKIFGKKVVALTPAPEAKPVVKPVPAPKPSATPALTISVSQEVADAAVSKGLKRYLVSALKAALGDTLKPMLVEILTELLKRPKAEGDKPKA